LESIKENIEETLRVLCRLPMAYQSQKCACTGVGRAC
jgi:hypothetical protein